jgi:hypothetical protein
VDALAPEIASLVEPVLLGPRLPDLNDRAQESALRRRAPRRKVEPCSLARALAIEAQHAYGHANLERASPARAGHLEQRRAGPADLQPKLAVVEGVQADAAPPQAGDEECRCQSEDTDSALSQAEGGERDRHRT